jgi:predicted amidophosphoribosyltransferase
MPASLPSLQPLLFRLLPPLCLTCRRAAPVVDVLLCERCDHALDALRPVRPLTPPGVSEAWSAAPHQGVARDLVVALKFRRLLPAAVAAADLIAERAPPELLSERTVVPVPPAPLRRAWRGYDPAGEIASALARLIDALISPCLRRRGSGRQRGRGRLERLAKAPRIEVEGPAPERPLLIDDVMTTGATLATCAAAMRSAGALDVKAMTFTHEL